MKELVEKQKILDLLREYDASNVRLTGEPISGIASIAADIEGLPAVRKLEDEDLLELEHRFGRFTRFIVEDMLSGAEKRWEQDQWTDIPRKESV